MARDEIGVIENGAAAPVIGDAPDPAAQPETPAAPAFALRPWTVDDTATFWTWIEADPELWRQWSLPGEPALVTLVVSLVTAQAGGSCLCAIVNDEARVVGIVGMSSVQRDGSAVVHLAIAPEARGIGRQLVPVLLPIARQLGATKLVAQVRHDNPRAKAFCESLGFVPVPYDVLVLTENGI
jgi:RimJ/RimL family protein N-acetyltransferase